MTNRFKSGPLLSICIPSARHPLHIEKTLRKMSKDLASAGSDIEICISFTGIQVEHLELSNALSDITSLKVMEEFIPAYSNLASVLEMAAGRFCLIIGDQYPTFDGSIAELLSELRNETCLKGRFLGHGNSVGAVKATATKAQTFLRAGMISGIVLPNERDFRDRLESIAKRFPTTIYPQIPMVMDLAGKYSFEFLESSRVERPNRFGMNPYEGLANRPVDFGMRERLFWLETFRESLSRPKIIKITFSLGIWIGRVARQTFRAYPGYCLKMVFSNIALGLRRPTLIAGLFFGFAASPRFQNSLKIPFRIIFDK